MSRVLAIEFLAAANLYSLTQDKIIKEGVVDYYYVGAAKLKMSRKEKFLFLQEMFGYQELAGTVAINSYVFNGIPGISNKSESLNVGDGIILALNPNVRIASKDKFMRVPVWVEMHQDKNIHPDRFWPANTKQRKNRLFMSVAKLWASLPEGRKIYLLSGHEGLTD